MVMTFPLGPTYTELNNSSRAHAENYMGILIALVNKGILSYEEFEKGKLQATHIVEQEFTRRQDEANQKFDAEHPGLRETLERLFTKDDL
jgi:hypothetical protein